MSIPKSEKLRNACEEKGDECLLEKIKVRIDGIETEVNKGTTILELAKKVGIKIPTLCYHKDLCLSGICRICVVEVEGLNALQSACSYSISQEITIKTHTKNIRRARRDILELMLARHVGECYSCVKNNNCELQSLAKDYGITSYTYGHSNKKIENKDNSSYSIMRDPDKCILCRRCIRTCVDLQEVGVFNVVNKGIDTKISTFGDKEMSDIICINCGQCVNRCPTGALYEKDDTEEVWKALENPKKHVIIQTAPAPRAGIGEEFGLEAGVPLTLQMNTALRYCGFDKVFDTCFTADLTIIEEGTELLLRLQDKLVNNKEIALPQFTSCSPGWVKFIEHFEPEMLDNLSSAKSPQQMFGSIIKTHYAQVNNIDPKDIVTVALMPCTAKKFEANRPEMNSSAYKDVDYGLTTRELAKMFKEIGIVLPKMPNSEFDEPFLGESGSGVIFGATGGVMESAIRTVYEIVTGNKIESIFEEGNIIPIRGFEEIKYAELTISQVGEVPELLKGLFDNFEFLKGVTLKVAVCHGTANAKKVLKNIKEKGKLSECHFIEFMACPGGCLGGGGQPIPTNKEIREKRAKAIYFEDKYSTIRKSHENPAVLSLYKEFLNDGPCRGRSHKLLHTKYTKRGNKIE